MFDIERLRRTKWTDAQMLAEELYAMLHKADEHGIDGPLKVNTNGTEPPIILNSPFQVDPVPIQVNAGGTQWNIPAMPGSFDPITTSPLTPSLIPGVPPAGPSGGGSPTSPTSPPPPFSPPSLPDREESGDELDEPPQADPPSLPFSAMGQVVSGTGKNYVVDLWLADPENGSSAPWGRFPARVMQIHTDDEVPAGTTVACVCYTVISSGVRAVKVYFQPPIIMDE